MSAHWAKIIQLADFDIRSIGNELEISGVLYGSGDNTLLILLPDEKGFKGFNVLIPTLEEWQKIVRQSDLKEIEGMDKGKKVILRKSTRQIETQIMWEVFRRDNYTCRYCGAIDRPLTVDHVVLWENMGPSIPINLISSCKKCNNARGNTEYEEWLMSSHYLDRIPSKEAHALNALVLVEIPNIKENHLRTVKRSR